MRDSSVDVGTSNEASPPKKAKIESPFSSPGSNNGKAPVLEPAVPIPNFNLAEVAEAYLATCSPPVLHPEIPLSSMAENCQPSTSKSLRAGSSTTTTAKQQAENKQGTMMPPIGFKTAERVSKVSSNSHTKELTEKLSKTIHALKNSTGNVRKNVNKDKLKSRIEKGETIQHQNRQTKKVNRSITIVKTPEQARKLEASYAANPNPAPSDVHEIAQELNITTSDVKKWYAAYRKQIGVRANDSSNSGISACLDDTGTSSRATKTRRVSGHIDQPSEPAGTSFPGADIFVQTHHDNGQTLPGEKRGNVRLKFFRQPELRTDDLASIKQDLEKLEKCGLDLFNALLSNNWEVKANRLLNIVSTEGAVFKNTIYTESRRLKELAAVVNPLSEEQERQVSVWEKKFIRQKVEDGKYGDHSTVRNAVEQAVTPWITPFMYSRTTQQDGRNLTLEVALCDLCKISNVQAHAAFSSDWRTPAFLQTDYTFN